MSGRYEQRLQNLDDLLPVEAGGAAVGRHKLVGQAYADDGTDHGVRTRGRQAEPPSSKVPQDGGDEQGEDHGESCAGADLEDEFDGQQRDDGIGNGARGEQHAGQVADSGPHDCNVRIERVGVDDRGHGVCSVVESVHELEAEGNEQRQSQQYIRPRAGDGYVVQVFCYVKSDIAEAAHQGQQECSNAHPARRFLHLAVKQGFASGHSFNDRRQVGH